MLAFVVYAVNWCVAKATFVSVSKKVVGVIFCLSWFEQDCKIANANEREIRLVNFLK